MAYNNGYFITGTDTDVGKTCISLGFVELLIQSKKAVGVMKPISAGCEKTKAGLRNSDALMLQQKSNIETDYNTINPYAFEPAIAPHLAAREAETHIEIETILKHYRTIQSQSSCVIVEGAGGWMVPLNDFQTMADLAKLMELPIILVVGMRLGCLSHALLTIDAIRHHKLPLAGWVANHIDPEMSRPKENLQTLLEMIDAPLLGRVPYLKKQERHTITKYLKLPMERHAHRPAWGI
ncbi:dethiobiotin synthase [Pseudomonadota bacterium]